jgi:hypothetical protein
MRLLSALGFGAFVLASLVVGARLLLLARRTRQAPEFAIGTALFLGGGVGYVLLMLVLGFHAVEGTPASAGVFLGSTATAIGAASLAFGVRRIFRPLDRASAIGVLVAAALLATTLGGRLLDPHRVPAAPWIFWIATTVSAAIYAWSALESFHFHTQMQRRVRLGIAEPALARRFLLWGVAASAAVGMHLASMLSRILVGTAALPEWLAGVKSAFGLVAAAGLWLAFFPSRRARARSTAEA